MRDLKGFASLEALNLFAKTIQFFKTNSEISRGEKVSLLNYEELCKFLHEEVFNNLFLYKFEKDEVDIILSFFEDVNGTPLSDTGNEYTPQEFKDYTVTLFKAINDLKIVIPTGFIGLTFQEAVEKLLDLKTPDELELKAVLQKMG